MERWRVRLPFRAQGIGSGDYLEAIISTAGQVAGQPFGVLRRPLLWQVLLGKLWKNRDGCMNGKWPEMLYFRVLRNLHFATWVFKGGMQRKE
jgi:hypothetical protein